MPELWTEAVKRIVQSRDGPISLQEIYGQMEHHQLVTLRHKAPWRQGGQPRFHCWIRRTLTTLVDRGEVRRIRTGVYISN